MTVVLGMATIQHFSYLAETLVSIIQIIFQTLSCLNDYSACVFVLLQVDF